MGWEQIEAAAALTDIDHADIAVEGYLNAGSAAKAAAENYLSIDGFNPAWYLTHPAGWDADQKACGRGCSGPKGWAMAWHRPGNGTLGGEVSMWADDYCKPLECDAWQNRFPPEMHKLANASCLYTRDMDGAFSKSIGGLTWPRGLVAAGSFWGFDYYAEADSHSKEFSDAIDSLSRRLEQRGSLLCSAGAHCDYLSQNGVRYAGIPANQTNGCYGGD